MSGARARCRGSVGPEPEETGLLSPPGGGPGNQVAAWPQRRFVGVHKFLAWLMQPLDIRGGRRWTDTAGTRGPWPQPWASPAFSGPATQGALSGPFTGRSRRWPTQSGSARAVPLDMPLLQLTSPGPALLASTLPRPHPGSGAKDCDPAGQLRKLGLENKVLIQGKQQGRAS